MANYQSKYSQYIINEKDTYKGKIKCLILFIPHSTIYYFVLKLSLNNSRIITVSKVFKDCT